MAYNSTTGSLHVGDLLNEDDEDTQVDFGYDSIIFRTNRLPRLQITNTSVSASGTVLAGKVGIGTTSPSHTLQIDSNSGVEGLQVNGDANQYVASFRASTTTGQSYGPYVRAGTNSSDAALTVENAAGSTSLLKLTGEGKLGIGVSDPDQILEVGGAVHVSGEVSSPSAPSDGDGGILYVKSDGKLYWISDEISETDLTSGGSGISWDGSTANGVATYKDSDEATVEANLTFDGNTLVISAGLVLKRRAITSTTTASATDYYLAIRASGDLDIRLPDASGLTVGQTFVLKDELGTSHLHNIAISASGDQTIDGLNFIELRSPFGAIQLYTDGSDSYFIY